MMNVNNILHIFNNLVRQNYPVPTQNESSSKDYELADRLLTSAELLIDRIVTLDFNEYDDCSADYEEEDENNVDLNVDGVKYSSDTMCAIVEFSKTHTFPTMRGSALREMVSSLFREECNYTHTHSIDRLLSSLHDHRG